MRTVGQVLKDARRQKGYTLEGLEKETKIKKEFLRSLEKEEWDSLPELPVIYGFVKNVASALELDPKQLGSLLRRDYPPKSLRINPKPDVGGKFTWSPKLTFFTAISVIFLIIVSYLVMQYINFISSPKLEVISPEEGMVVSERVLTVSGFTNTDATLRVNNQPVLVDDEGGFESRIEVYSGTEEVVFIARSRSGKETTLVRRIVAELE